jgi:hypothetical protein
MALVGQHRRIGTAVNLEQHVVGFFRPDDQCNVRRATEVLLVEGDIASEEPASGADAVPADDFKRRDLRIRSRPFCQLLEGFTRPLRARVPFPLCFEKRSEGQDVN